MHQHTTRVRAGEASGSRPGRIVLDAPATKSPMGDAITATAAKIGKSDMTDRSGGFDIRFVLLQAQATRMVNAVATATARFDHNRERKAWLKSLAVEYEGYRNTIIRYLSQDREVQKGYNGV